MAATTLTSPSFLDSRSRLTPPPDVPPRPRLTELNAARKRTAESTPAGDSNSAFYIKEKSHNKYKYFN